MYWQCKEQNGVEFDCFPRSSMTLFTGDPTHWERIPDIITAHQLIRQSKVPNFLDLRIPVFIYLGFYVAFNTVQVISRRVVGRAEETSIYSSLGLCTVNCRPMASNYQLSHLRPSRGSNPGLRGGRR